MKGRANLETTRRKRKAVASSAKPAQKAAKRTSHESGNRAEAGRVATSPEAPHSERLARRSEGNMPLHRTKKSRATPSSSASTSNVHTGKQRIREEKRGEQIAFTYQKYQEHSQEGAQAR